MHPTLQRRMSSGYIYLLQPLRSITDNEEIYKIGKTKRNNFKRFNEYPIGSILLLQSSCKNCDLMERRLLKIFDEKFIKQKDYGIEYFKGDLFEMKKVINSEIMYEEVDVDINNNEILSSNNLIEFSTVIESEVVEMYDKTDEEPCIAINNIEKNNKRNYSCEKCDYYTREKTKFTRHCFTEKHKKMKDGLQKGEKNTLQCSCGKLFNFRQGLHKHKKICESKKINSLEQSHNAADSEKILSIPFVIDLINQNKEFKDILILQSKQLIEQANQHLKNKDELINKLIEREYVKGIIG